jgi:hypothetical protein
MGGAAAPGRPYGNAPGGRAMGIMGRPPGTIMGRGMGMGMGMPGGTMGYPGGIWPNAAWYSSYLLYCSAANCV